MMRITNSMMTSNTKNNINLNKLNEDKVNTQMASGQKITRPSDDPVIAIRALRLNTSLSQLQQYQDKNIPDANAWLKITETALLQANGVFDTVKENLTTGASDTCTASDRMKLLTNLQGLRSEIYSAGNADYAGRTVFTGYRTNDSLTFLETDTDLDSAYSIYQELSASDIRTDKYIMSADKTESGGTYEEANVESYDIYKIRLPYGNLDASQSVTIATDSSPISITTMSIAGLSQSEIDDIYTSMSDSSATGGILIPETGEIILSESAKNDLEASSNASITYSKNAWKSGDLRPEHYYACVKQNAGAANPIYYNFDYTINPSTGERTYTTPNFEDQEIKVEISFNQKITINTNANKVFTHDIGRDIDDLIASTQDVIDVETKIEELKKELSKETNDTLKAAIQVKLDGANKEFALKKDKMQKMFSAGLNQFEAYADRNNLAIANVGNISSRLAITKERVTDQIESFKELADDNINISLTDTAIDLKNAELALQAAQLAASKIAQQTLLNYL